MSAAWFNRMGIVILVLGLGSALWIGRPNHPAANNSTGDWQDSTLALTDSKTNTRNIELYGGKLQVLMVKVLEWSQQRQARAIFVAAFSCSVALGCFLIAAFQRKIATGNVR